MVVVDALPVQPTQELPKLPADTPPFVFAIVYGSIAIIVVVGAIGRYLGGRTTSEKKKSDPAPAPAPSTETGAPDTAATATVTGTVAQQAEASQALMERLVAGLEKRLDEALTTQRDIQARYQDEINALRSQLSAEQQEKWQLTGQMQNLQRQLENAHTEVIQLRAELAAVRTQQRGSW